MHKILNLLLLVDMVFLAIGCQAQGTSAPAFPNTPLPEFTNTPIPSATIVPTETATPRPTVTFPAPLPFQGTPPSGIAAHLGLGELGRPALSPNGSYLAVTSGIGIILYHPETLAEISVLPQMDYMGAIAWAPDSRRLAAVSSLKSVTIWDVEKVKAIQTLTVSDVSFLAWSPDGKRLALANGDKIVEIWNLNPVKLIRSFAKHAVIFGGWGASELQWVDENKIVSLDEYSQLLLWETDTGKVIRTWSKKRNDSPRQIAISPDRKTLAIASMQGNKILLWDLVSRREKKTIDIPRLIMDMDWSPDGKSLALITQFPSKLVVVNVDNGIVQKEFWTDNYSVGGLSWLQNGKEVITMSGSGDGDVLTVWDIQTGQGIHSVRSLGANLVAWSADGKTIAASDGKAIVLWDMQTGKPHVLPGEIRNGVFDGGSNYVHVMRMAFSPSGNLLAAETGDDSSFIRIWDILTGKLIGEVGADGEHLTELYWISDTQLIARTVWKNNVWIWDARNWENAQTISLDSFDAEHLDISSDGKLVALIREDTLEIREIKDGKKLYSWKVDWEPKMGLFWSPDGTKIAVIDVEKLTIYEAGTGKKLNSLRLTPSGFRSLEWSPDSSSIVYLLEIQDAASISERGMVTDEIYLWHITAANTSLVTRTQKSAYLLSKDSFCFSPDGKDLAIALRQKGLIIWQLP